MTPHNEELISLVPEKIIEIVNLWEIYCGIVGKFFNNEYDMNYYLYCGWEDPEPPDLDRKTIKQSKRYKEASKHHVHIFFNSRTNTWDYNVKNCNTDDCLDPSENKISKGERENVPIWLQKEYSPEQYLGEMWSTLNCRENESYYINTQILNLTSVWKKNYGDVIFGKDPSGVYTYFMICGNGGWGIEDSERYIYTTSNYVRLSGNRETGWYIYVKNADEEQFFTSVDLRFNFMRYLEALLEVFKC